MMAINGENLDDIDEYRRVKQAFFRTIGPEVNPIEANKLGDRFRGFEWVPADDGEDLPGWEVLIPGSSPLTWGEARQRLRYLWANEEVREARAEWAWANNDGRNEKDAD